MIAAINTFSNVLKTSIVLLILSFFNKVSAQEQVFKRSLIYISDPYILADVKSQSYYMYSSSYGFGRYFSDKLKAAVHVARYRFAGKDERNIAVKYLTDCKQWWMNYANALAKYNHETMPFHTSTDFSWKVFQKNTEMDIELAKQDR